MAPLHGLLAEFFDQNPLGFVLAFLQQFGDEFPVRLGDRGRAGVQERDLRRRGRLEVQYLGFPVA